MATFHEYRCRGLPLLQHLLPDPSPTRVFQMQPIGVVIPRESYSGYGSLVAHKLHRFTEPITRHVTSTVQKLIKGMPRTGLNRHGRGYATKEAGSAVHFPVSGPIGLARSHILHIHHYISIGVASF